GPWATASSGSVGPARSSPEPPGRARPRSAEIPIGTHVDPCGAGVPPASGKGKAGGTPAPRGPTRDDPFRVEVRMTDDDSGILRAAPRRAAREALAEGGR